MGYTGTGNGWKPSPEGTDFFRPLEAQGRAFQMGEAHGLVKEDSGSQFEQRDWQSEQVWKHKRKQQEQRGKEIQIDCGYPQEQHNRQREQLQERGQTTATALGAQINNGRQGNMVYMNTQKTGKQMEKEHTEAFGMGLQINEEEVQQGTDRRRVSYPRKPPFT
jgi:hypothetical protein